MKNKLKKNTKQLTQGGMINRNNNTLPDIVLQMSEVFMFNMQTYMNSIMLAKSIDFSNRVRLYDMYDSAQLDLHLSGCIAKRLRGVTRFPVEFQRDGKVDDEISKQLRSPWFKNLRKDIIMSEFYGFSLMQFYNDDDGNIRYDLINRKHYDPIHKKILKYQGDQSGLDVDDFDNMLFVGSERELGIFSELLPAVLYKRGDMSDWAQFCNIFGMPIREYTYDAGDEEARKNLVADARRQGSNAVYIHPKDSNLNLVESGNKTGSSDLYKSFADYWDSKISIRVLGNTLTTDAKDTGTQALGTVHKEEENDMNTDDRDFILDVLNYYMRQIFQNLGYNIENGEFVYAEKEKIDTSKQIDIVTKLNALGLPISDDWLYETFNVEKPKDYDTIKAKKEEEKEAIRNNLNDDKTPLEQHSNDEKKGNELKNTLRSFFGIAR